MVYSILRHGWLGFRRAHYFKRGLGIKLLIGFVIFTILWYMYLLGNLLPDILQGLHPDKPPHQSLFTYLVFIYAGDLAFRLFSQKVPRQSVAPYLHLPIRRSRLAALTLVRSWFSILNVYLLALLIPFFLRTVYHTLSPGAFWNIIVGCFLLAGLNHSLFMLLKTSRRIKAKTTGLLVVLLLAAGLGGWVFREQIMGLSANLGSVLLAGHPAAFLALFSFIALIQPLASKGLQSSFYDLSGQSGTRAWASGGIPEKIFSRFPGMGPYLDLEWKLISRNKRSRQNIMQIPFLIPVVLYLVFTTEPGNLPPMTPILLMGMGSYGFMHLQYVFSWESRFFDFIGTKGFELKTFIRAKYTFHILLALLQFLILMPFVLIWKPGTFPFLLGVFLYAVGPVYCMLFYTGLGNSTRIDPNQKAFFNFEGNSGALFFTIILIFMTTIPLFIIGGMIPLERPMGFSLAAGVVGLAFVGFSRWWTADVAGRFTSKKYRNLNKYREK